MKVSNRIRNLAAGLGAAALLLSGCAEVTATLHGGKTVNFFLSGSNEVPAVSTNARGEGTITVSDDGTVAGRVTTSGIDGVAAHIHTGGRSENGPVAVGLVKSSDTVWSVPTGARLNEAQLAAFKAGNTYVNVHSAAYKGGEIRAQLMP